MKRILAIDGGGIRGLLPALILEELEARAGKPARELFDLIAGNSTGGIIATGLLAGVPAAKIVAMYRERGGEIFADRGAGIVRPKYSAANLEAILRDMFGETWLSETKGPEFLACAYCCDPRSAYFFKSWKARGTALDPGDKQDDLDFRLWQIARATSAAETYFPTAEITAMSGKTLYMMDGGTFANNPALAAVFSAARLWGNEPLNVLSLGTGTAAARPIDGKASQGWGAIEWVTEGGIVDICMDGTADIVAYGMDCLGVDRWVTQIRIQASLPAEAAAMDDASPDNIARLGAIAGDLVKQHGAALDAAIGWTAP